MLEDASTIDDGWYDQITGDYVLALRHEGPWDAPKKQAALLYDKLKNYEAFVHDGFLFRIRPEAEGKMIRVEVDAEPMPDAVLKAFEQAQREMNTSAFFLSMKMN